MFQFTATSVNRGSFRYALMALCLLPALAACASTPRSAIETDSVLDHDMMATGLEDIESVYIADQDVPKLTLVGLKNLSDLDPAVSTRYISGQLELLVNNNAVRSVAIDSGDDIDAWAEASAEILYNARADSTKIAAAGHEKIYDAVFSGMIEELDPFSRYAGANAAKENRASREGFGGIGVRISVEEGVVRIVSIMHYTPAERLGLMRDDIILKIDGESVDGMSQQEVVAKLRGPVDSRVDLTLKRGKADKPIEITLQRAHVVPETVSYRREGQIAYFHIFSFNSETTDSLKREIEDAKNEIGASRVKGYILDLRGNPGGLLSQAVSTSNLFLEDGRIVSTHGRHPDSHQYFEASEGDIANAKPIAVLIDGNSASAAEIVAAALQDNGRAVVVGSNSYGKGTVQNVLPLPNEGELTLTWARFHAPSGYTLHHLGVLPTLCTVGKSGADQILSALQAGSMPTIPTVRRNAVKPDDLAALDDLRKTCPGRKTEEAIDLEVALKLLNAPTLYAGAIDLAIPPASAKLEDSVEARLILLP
jgi:carboxyl-terminal processing protease